VLVDGILQQNNRASTMKLYFTINSNWNEWGDTSSWYLAVGHVWPAGSGTGSNKAESGIYNTSGSLIYTADLTDFVWRAETTSAVHRSYLYYSTDTATRQRWAYPRVDIVDGNEPSIQDLIKGAPVGLTNDSSGEENDITIFNNTTFVDGKYGNALNFDGTDDWARIDGDMEIDGAMTIAFWFYTPDKNTNQYFFDNRNPGSWWFIKNYTGGTCGTIPGNICFEDRVMAQDADWNTNEWTHIAVTDDTSTAKMYINGDLVDTGPGEVTTISTNLRLATRYSNTGYLNGKIDEIKVYNRALSPDEITYLYESSEIKSDYEDIRFTDTDRTTVLDYWMERDGVFWVEIPLITASSEKIIYMYSDNSGAESISNGDTTFDYFDDFSSDTSGNYTTVGAGIKYYDKAREVLKQVDTSNAQHWIACTVDILPDDYVYQADVKINNDPSGRNNSGLATDFSTSAVTGYRLTHLDAVFPVSKWSSGSETGIGSFADGGIYADNKWLTERIYRNRTSGLLKYEITDGMTSVSNQYSDTTHTTGHLGFHSYGSEVWYDNIFVRKHTSPEPTTFIGIPNFPISHEATSIGPYEATLHGEIVYLPEEDVTQRGFDWGISQGGPYTESWTEEGVFGLGNFSRQVQDLDDDTVYYFRAKAYSAETGWAYGAELSFETPNDSLQISTVSSEVKTGENVDLTGSIDQVSTQGNPTQRGFEWGGTAGGPYLYSWSEEGDFSAEEFYYSLDGLIHNTTYYFRAKARDLEGWTYGEEMMFTTYYDPHPGAEEEITFSIEEHDEGWLGTEDNVSVTSEGLVLSSGVSGTRTSASYDLSSIGTSGGSEISWSGDIPNFAGSLGFDGLDDYVVVDTSPTIPSGSNQVTVSYWMKANSFSDDWQYAFHLHRDVAGTNIGNSVIWGGLSSSNNIVLTIGGVDGHYSDGDTGITPVLGDWYHVAAVWDGGYVKVYVNGNQELMYPRPSLTTASSPIHIGAHQNGGGYRQFNATIDEVRIWSVARTQEQIQNNMYQELYGNESGLIGYWKFNEMGGSVAYDSSSSSNNGTITGASWTDGIQTSVGVETNVSLNGGVVWEGWQSVNNGDPIVGLEHGTDISNGRLQVRQTLTTNNASVSPLVESSTINIFLYYGLYDEHGANVGGWAWSENIGWISFNNDDVADYLASYNSSSGELEGWAWSENIGWLSWNCATDSTCNPATEDYKVSISEGNLSGWAWSDNLGWLSFDRNVTGDPPGAPYQSDGAIARYDSGTRRFSGWARFTEAPEGDWDGWVKLRCDGDECDGWTDENSSTGGLFVRDDNYLDGWIWGSDVVGWIGMMGVGAYNYGLNINTENFKLRGHIWSDNLGWITFNRDGPLGAGEPPENDPCPLEDDCIAMFDPDESTLSGWARAIRYGDGWDGWISLRGTALDESTYGVSLNPATRHFEGWAYGGEVLGWISFNSLNEVSNPPEYYVYTTMELGLDASGLASEWNYCIDTLHPTLSWETEETSYGYAVEIYSDVDLNNLVYQYEAGDSEATSHHPDYDAGNCHVDDNGYQNTGVCDLEYSDQDYWWRVKVKDSEGQWGSWSAAVEFTVENDHHWPEPGFSFLPDPSHIEEETNFTDESTAYGGSSLSNWLWILSGTEGIDYNYVNDTTDESQNPDIIFVNADEYSASLDVWDSSGYGPCRLTQSVSVDEASDLEWREVSPTN